MDFNQRFVVLDIETTGLNYEYFDEPTEIALIEIDKGKITGKQKHFYLKPYKKVSLNFLEKVFGKEILKEFKTTSLDIALNKVEESLKKNPEDESLKCKKEEILDKKLEASNMLANINKGKSKYVVLPEVRKFIGDSPVIAHNANFDINFLNSIFFALNLELINKYICTFKSFKEHFNFKKNNLTECCNYYKIEFNGAHNALEDTEACAKLFLEEIKDFPDDIKYFEFDKLQSYVNFKKRIVNASYFAMTKKVLEEASNANEKLKFEDTILRDKIFNLFYNFKKPLEVSNILGVDLYETQSLFLQWVDCININKHLDLIREKNLSSFCKEILVLCNRDFNKIREVNLGLFDNEPNYFVYKLYEKLEFKKEEMTYTLDELDYYFDNLYSLEDLNKKIGKGYDYICEKLIEWIGTDEERINQYELFLKDTYSKKTDVGQSLKKAIDSSPIKSLLI